jgi:uncharacterized protein YndB with AHSA1/START domain
MSMHDKLHVYLERRLTASPERVFDAWIEPALLSQWMFGPAVRDEEILDVTIDPRAGGFFSFAVRRQGQQITHVGRYLQMTRPRRLVFTWGIGGVSEEESRVVVDLLAAGTACELTLMHELRPHLANYAAVTEAGWMTMLDRLTSLLAHGAAPRHDSAR